MAKKFKCSKCSRSFRTANGKATHACRPKSGRKSRERYEAVKLAPRRQRSRVKVTYDRPSYGDAPDHAWELSGGGHPHAYEVLAFGGSFSGGSGLLEYHNGHQFVTDTFRWRSKKDLDSAIQVLKRALEQASSQESLDDGIHRFRRTARGK